MQFSVRKSTAFCCSQPFDPSICLPTSLSIKWETCPCAGEDCIAGTKLDDRAGVKPCSELVPKVTVGNSKPALTCDACSPCQCPRGNAGCEDASGHASSVLERGCGWDLSPKSPSVSICLPGWLKQTTGWLYCWVYPWVRRDLDIPPLSLLPQGVAERGVCSFGMPLPRSDRGETNRLLGRESVKNKIKGSLQITVKLETGLSESTVCQEDSCFL